MNYENYFPVVAGLVKVVPMKLKPLVFWLFQYFNSLATKTHVLLF